MSEEKTKIKISINKKDKAELIETGFDFKWLDKLGKQYGFEYFEYFYKFRAFRCYQYGQHVEWISINDLSLLNGGRKLLEILLKHQILPKHRQIIEMPWR